MEKKKPAEYVPPQIKNIMSFNNFEYHVGDPNNAFIRMWRAYGIGSGVLLQKKLHTSELSWINRATAHIFNSADPGFIIMNVGIVGIAISYITQSS